MTCAGALLTGGASRRMGTDKATLPIGGELFAVRAARVLSEVCAPVFEAGRGITALPAVQEDPPGEGPLAAVLAVARVVDAPALLVVGCDLPFLTREVVALLAGHPGNGSVVPEVGGRLQYACARWSAGAITSARDAYARGERALRVLATAGDVTVIDANRYATELTDIDTPHDFDRAGLTYDRGS